MFRPAPSSQREAHEQAVQNIADQLFPFPTPEYPHFRTMVNKPETTQKIFTNYGNELEPDIVVLQWPEKIPVMIAEVLTEDMLTDENAKIWAIESRLDNIQFYLYVPAGSVKKSKDLLKKHGLKKNIALRTWRNITGLKTVDVAALR